MSENSDDKKVHWLNLRYTEQQCPGMREVLAMAPKDQQSALVRGILYQWCLVHQQQGTLMQAMTAALNGPGVKGERGLRRPRKGAGKAVAEAQPAAATRTAHETPPSAPVLEPQQPPPVAAPTQSAPPPPAPVPATDPRPAPPAQHAAPPPPPPPADEQPLAADTAASALFDMFDDD